MIKTMSFLWKLWHLISRKMSSFCSLWPRHPPRRLRLDGNLTVLGVLHVFVFVGTKDELQVLNLNCSKVKVVFSAFNRYLYEFNTTYMSGYEKADQYYLC